MPKIALTREEVALLLGAARRGDVDRGFQELLQTLCSLINRDTNQIYISQHTLEIIQRYGSTSGNATWRGLLRCVFRRTLGDDLGRKRDASGRILDTDKDPDKDAD